MSTTVPSLSCPPNAPKKKAIVPILNLERISKLQFGEKTEPSTPHPPDAPKKKKVVLVYASDNIPKLSFDEEESWDFSAWRWELDVEMVREQFFSVLPEEVMGETDPRILKCWRNLYSPSSQPQTAEEHYYVDFMSKSIDRRLHELAVGDQTPVPEFSRSSDICFI